MTSRRPAPAVHVAIRIPRVGPSPADGWVAETYRLIDRFECDRRRTLGHDAEPGASFVIAASDYLWERYHTEARWDRFELRGLFTLFAPFLLLEGWSDDCVATLKAFFDYLERTHVIDRKSARRIQAELAAD